MTTGANLDGKLHVDWATELSSAASARLQMNQYLAVLPDKDGCKNQFYRQIRLASFRKNEKIFWHSMNDKPHGSRKECWRGPLFKLCHPSSKSGRFKWRSGNHYSTKHKFVHNFAQNFLCEIVNEAILQARYPFKDWANVPVACHLLSCSPSIHLSM